MFVDVPIRWTWEMNACSHTVTVFVTANIGGTNLIKGICEIQIWTETCSNGKEWAKRNSSRCSQLTKHVFKYQHWASFPLWGVLMNFDWYHRGFSPVPQHCTMDCQSSACTCRGVCSCSYQTFSVCVCVQFNILLQWCNSVKPSAIPYCYWALL